MRALKVLTGHVIYNLFYTNKYQLKTTSKIIYTWKSQQNYFGSILARGVSKHTVYSQEFYNNVGQNRWEISDTCLAQ